MNRFLKLALLFLGGIFFSLSTINAQANPLTVTGAGATFPYPIYSKWFYEYNKMHPDIQFNYQSIGSGGGIQQLLAETVDFGASDAPMNDTELAKSSAPIVHIPTVLGAVVLAYNVPSLSAATPLKLSGSVISEIYLGTITKWNDVKIAQINPGVVLPATPILPIQRSDGSGTTYVFTDYLSKVSSNWKEKVGTGKSVKWPTGLGAKGNEGVTGLVKQSPGSIGYIELGYAIQNKLAYASVQNKSGQFVAPTMENVSKAADGALATMPNDFRLSLTNADGERSYPISSFTYLLLYKSHPKKAQGEALIQFLKWAVTDGQRLATSLHYAPLPPSLIARIKSTIDTITIKGK